MFNLVNQDTINSENFIYYLKQKILMYDNRVHVCFPNFLWSGHGLGSGMPNAHYRMLPPSDNHKVSLQYLSFIEIHLLCSVYNSFLNPYRRPSAPLITLVITSHNLVRSGGFGKGVGESV